MILDALIYKIALAALIMSCIQMRAIVPAGLLCASLFINELVFIQNPTWQQLENWAWMLSIKDGALLIAIGLLRLKISELALLLSFAICCLFNRFMLMEIRAENLDLLHIRSNFMLVVSALQLATIIFILTNGSTRHGGKRIRRYFYSFYSNNYGRIHNQTCKVEK